MKDYLIYYQHFTNSHDHWKFKLLRSLLGWSAEGRFWALNNMIARSSQCILNLNKKAIKASVMSDLQLDETEFDNLINILTNQCELLINIDGNISTDIVRENHKEVMKERIRTKERREKTISETKPFNLIKLSTDKS
jgi:hypothetical protein